MLQRMENHSLDEKSADGVENISDGTGAYL